MGIYKRKIRKQELDQKKRSRKQEKKRKKTRSRPRKRSRKTEKNFFFLDRFLGQFLGRGLLFFYKFPPLALLPSNSLSVCRCLTSKKTNCYGNPKKYITHNESNLISNNLNLIRNNGTIKKTIIIGSVTFLWTLMSVCWFVGWLVGLS